jgi:hypothetical protein
MKLEVLSAVGQPNAMPFGRLNDKSLIVLPLAKITILPVLDIQTTLPVLDIQTTLPVTLTIGNLNPVMNPPLLPIMSQRLVMNPRLPVMPLRLQPRLRLPQNTAVHPLRTSS